MRSSPREQEDFLEHGRFGETNHKVVTIQVPKLVIAGQFFLAVGISVLALIWFFDIGEAEGVLYLYGAALSELVGLMFCLWSGVSKLSERRRRSK